jgi:hypothetical protein
MRDFGDKWVIGIRICEHRTNREEDFGDRKSRGPLITEDVKTNTAVGVDIWMIDSCREVYLWWFEGVVCGKVNREEKHTAGIWTVARSHDRCLPVEQIISYGSRTAT